MSVLADWLARQAPAWLDGPRPLTPAQRRALLAISRCRTPALGGHLYRCTDCDTTDFAYHSCHHRACPRCGGSRTAEWTERQTEQLLPVPYFLVTFTVPEQLRPVFLAQPALLHDLLFTQAAAALQLVARRPRLLGAVLGMIGVLHTWGRQLQYHPHLHFIIPGGGLSAEGTKWVPSRQPDWLLPMQAVSAAFRKRFDDALRTLGAIPDDGPLAISPELRAQAVYWRGVALVASGEPSGMAKLDEAAGLIERVRTSVPEPYRASFAARRGVQPIAARRVLKSPARR